MKLIILITIVACLAVGANAVTTAQLLAAGKCQPFDGQPRSCASFMVGSWSQVWTVPAYGVTQEYLEAQLFAILTRTSTGGVITKLELTNIMPFDCAVNYLKLACSAAFKPCTETPLEAQQAGAPPAIPHSLCQEACDDVNVACASFWSNLGLPPINCQAIDNSTGAPVYPPSSFNPNLGFFTCFMPPELNSTPTYTCPQDTTNIGPDDVDETSHLPCAVPCRRKMLLPVDGPSNFFDQYVALSVLGWISFVSINITLLTYLLFKPLRRYPQRIIMETAIGLWVLHLGQVGSSFFGVGDLLCDGEWHFQVQTGSWCKFAAFCLFWGAMFTAMLWAYLAFIIFWNVALLRVKDKRAQYGEYIVVPLAILFSTIETLILLFYPDESASGGYLSGFPFCGLGPGADRNLFWGIFIAPIIFYLLIVVMCTVAAIVKIVITPTGDSVKKALGKRLPAQLLLLVFVLSFMTVSIAVIATQAYGQEFRPLISEGIENYYSCLYTQPIHYDQCQAGPVFVSNDIWWFQQIMISIIGFIFFITFVVLKAEVRNLWVATCRNLGRGEFSIASTDIYASTRGATGASSGSHSGR